MDYIEVSAKTVEDAITEACQLLTVTSDRLDYEVIQNGSSGFLGLNVKPAIIRAKVKDTKAAEAVVEDKVEVVFDKKEEVADNKSNTKNVSNSENVDYPAMAKEFLASVFEAMNSCTTLKIRQPHLILRSLFLRLNLVEQRWEYLLVREDRHWILSNILFHWLLIRNLIIIFM